MSRSVFLVLVSLALFTAAGSVAAETTWYGFRGEPNDNNLYLSDPLRRGDLFPVNLNNHWGLADRRGYVIIPPRFDWTDNSYDGVARAIRNGRTGFIIGGLRTYRDLKLDVFVRDVDWYIEPRFEWVDRFEENYAVFRERGRYGYIDRRGEVTHLPEFDGALRFRENVAAVQVRDRVGYLDTRFKLTIPPRFAVGRSFHQNRAAVQLINDEGLPGAWGFINRKGKLLWADPTGRIDELGDFNDGLAKVRLTTGRWGYLNLRYELEIEPAFDGARDFTNGLAAVRVDGKGWGYINRAGDWELDPQFEDADDFDDRLAMIRRDGSYGFIDRAGKTGIFPQFREAEPFFRGVARVARHDSFAYITDVGQVPWDPGVPLRSGRDPVLLDRTLGSVADRERRDTFRVGGEFYPLWLLPPKRAQPPIPYEPEYLYEERLPRPPRGGLIESPLEPADQLGPPENPGGIQAPGAASDDMEHVSTEKQPPTSDGG